ncbi:7-cyano-7-deazaguanine synthase QueC [Piscirickettsia litoralis]|uniref:7-cyano-7-deazaguanine synthase n=1 Tax=Piscirickettsia litoralis TaxID=1891921 RepID=A0ABX3A8C1_9GAMM|nr:7-cyano-7-deazaguanine synthase QueC [Piscirickettsia litoralis]ODN43898.1 7-cyano-7-deazaguanine synthase QueC [Piscirickettsia litoralis]
MTKKAVVLASGGLDSTTCIALAKSQGFEVYAMSFDYGQQHNAELDAVKRIVKKMAVKQHEIIKFSMDGIAQGSALTNSEIEVPDYQGDGEIPVTYVPARNTIFLSMALGWAEVLGAQDIFIGVSEVDYSGYPDCRPEYIEAFANMANLATKAGVEGNKLNIHAPLSHLSKAETIQLGLKLGVDYRLTVSCYRADHEGRACGQCDSCAYRKKGFIEAGVEDPTPYY